MHSPSQESRTMKSLHNSVVAMVMVLLNLGLQFFSRKVFLDYLGTDILGLNTTATNLLQFLNLAELGIGNAVVFALFKPLAEKDHEATNEIMAIMGWLYKRIGLFIIIGAVILSFFFPLIFKKITLPIWYAYASFGVLLFSGLLSYFVTYRQIILTADQRDYKIQYSYRLVMMIKTGCQMVAVYYLAHGYVWWLVLEAIFAVVSALTITRTVNHTYPFLKKIQVTSQMIRSKYSTLVLKIKQLFFHRIGTFVLTQTSPLIIYAYTTLTMVALYGNYMLIINGIIMLLNAVFNSMGAGVGNLIASSDLQKSMKVFRELFSIRFVVILSLCLCVYYIVPEFIVLWIGKEYLLSNFTLLLMIGIFYIMTSRLTVDAFINGFGLFGDIWSPVVEGALNIGLSILLGAFFQLNGIIGGVLISLVVTMLIWKPYYLFTRELKGYLGVYIKDYLKHLLVGGVTVFCVAKLTHSLHPLPSHNILELLLFGGGIFLVAIILTGTGLLIVPTGMRYFINRILKKK